MRILAILATLMASQASAATRPGGMSLDVSAPFQSADIQAFTAGTGAYTWLKPSWASRVFVLLQAAGGGGGSGGFSSNDAGGGSGAGGAVAIHTFPASQLSASETITLGVGGAGGARVNVDGPGLVGGDPGSTSFGSYLIIDPNNTDSGRGICGGGGTTAQGDPGAGSAVASYTTGKASTVFAVSTINGALGHDTVAGASSSSAGLVTVPEFTYYQPTGGGGGGGTNSGSNFTNGGAAGDNINGFSLVVRAGGTAATTSGANGGAGTDGGYLHSLTANGPINWAGGTGGGGGAGAVTASTNGGTGGAGGNCGGGGGGGGASLTGTLGSGAGGKGGDGCILVISY